MAVPNSDQPREEEPIGKRRASANRPVADAPSGTPPQRDLSRVASSRPIPLPQRSADEFPDEDDDEDLEDEQDDLREIIKNAPAWLVSTVFHMVLLIVLGLLVVSAADNAAELEIEAGYSEDLGEQLENPSVMVADANPEELVTEPVVAPSELPPVEDPLVAPPQLQELELTPLATFQPMTNSDSNAPGIALALSGRRAGSRQALLKQFGGTKATEEAVELGLKWLAEQQRSDGSWSLSGPYPDGARDENTAAATAMALLAFQGHGDTHKTGNYQQVVGNGWKALLKMQLKDGRFAGTMHRQLQQLYTHAQCTIAVCELYGMTKDPAFRTPASRAVAYCVDAQDPAKGGWRYYPQQDSDTSVTGWFMMALQSARMAELKVPEETLLGINRYLDIAAIKDGRQYGYWGTANSSPAMSAEGLLCRQYLGWPRNDPRLVEGVSALLDVPVTYNAGRDVNVYYWYYATQAAHHMEGEIWTRWNNVMREEVPAHQVKEGPQAGSWDSQIDIWGVEGGRLFVTCLSIYNLEVYYRHLPLYSRLGTDSSPPPVISPDAKSPDAASAAVDGDNDDDPVSTNDTAPTDNTGPGKDTGLSNPETSGQGP